MEKLLNLLNEYKKHMPYHFTGYDEEYQMFMTSLDLPGFMDISAEIVISKKFGFIQWLVEKRKVKYFLIPEIIKKVEVDSSGLHDYNEYYEDLESLLMHLSIQDDPISFLVSILK